MDNNKNLIIFKTFSTFINDLGELFSSHQRSLKLYVRLINKTTISHDIAIKKHISIIRDFCITNRNAILSKEENKIILNKIEYSTRVFIEIPSIFKIADKDSKAAIWKHLIFISALVDPTSNAKQILKENKVNNTETNFLTGIIENIDQHIKPDSSPMETISSIFSSGMLTDLVSGMNNGFEDGSLDISKLLGSVQSLITSVSKKETVENQSESSVPDFAQMMGPMLGMLNGMGNLSENNDVPDFAQMMSPMLGMLNGMGNSSENNGTSDFAQMMSPMLGMLNEMGNSSENNGTSDFTQMMSAMIGNSEKKNPESELSAIEFLD